MADDSCSGLVRLGGDLGLAPDAVREGLTAHLAECRDCATYAEQIATTRTLLGQLTPPERAGVAGLRDALIDRARLIDAANAEDPAQQALATGLALQQQDDRPRGFAELTSIMRTLSEAEMRLATRSTPDVDVTAVAQQRADSLEDLDRDADEAELFYPDLYPGDHERDGWVDSPTPWGSSTGAIDPERNSELDETYQVLDAALEELPEPLGELLVLVDLEGKPVDESARTLGLDQRATTAALARARNHIRGRLDAYLAPPLT